jgi:pyrimidine deaminase RibD-like protein
MNLPTPFRLAKEMSETSKMNPKVGAVIVLDKQRIVGHNKPKTHTKYANPEKHVRKSIHAELDCLNKLISEDKTGAELYVYRELEGMPAMARPCNHCMNFIREVGIEKIYYTIPHEPYWEMEIVK